MTEADLPYLPATTLAPMIRSKQISPVELMSAVLDRIAKLEPQLNAFAFLDAEGALAGARAAETQLMKSAPLGALHGLPVTIKDISTVAGMPMRQGSHTLGTAPSAEDTPFVTRLKAAGAIVVGKTTLSEFGWSGVSRSPLTGITNNPWKLGYNAGASSAGAAVGGCRWLWSVAPGQRRRRLDPDAAHFCGVYGIKPSFGRVPYAPLGVGDNTSHVGPDHAHGSAIRR